MFCNLQGLSGYTRMCLASMGQTCSKNGVSTTECTCLQGNQTAGRAQHQKCHMAPHGHAPSTAALCPPPKIFVYHKKSVSTTGSVCLPQGTCVYHRACLSTKGNVCPPQGMLGYHRACLSTTWHVCLPQGMFVYHRECLATFVYLMACLPTTGDVCLPQGMCSACGIAVHADPPAALSSCQKKTSVDRDSMKCLL